MGKSASQEKVWESIAAQWNNFRQMKFQPLYDFFERHCKGKKGKVLDIGCGNARNLLPFSKNFECYGIDFSGGMISLAKQFCKKHGMKCILKKADMRNLPFRSNFFDVCIMPASLHNVEENPEKALTEMHRVLKSGGIVFISVWNKWQPKFFFRKKNLLIPWKKKNKILHRYYHLYNYFELRKMLKKAGFKILSSTLFTENLIFVVRK
jgi:ubiquinone/menaquinone biosynthesis C-methylase UbiE